MHWCTLRTDDVQWLDVARMVFTDNGLSLILRRSKTTGPDKKAREVPVYIHRTISLRRELAEGWPGTLQACWKRPYFLACPSRDYLCCHRKYLPPEQLSLRLKGMYMHLSVPLLDGNIWKQSDNCLVPEEVQNFWTGHSARRWLPSWATALGMPKCDHDFLGRWQVGARQSTEYVVKAREVVFRVQKGVNAALCQGHEAVNEHELFDELKQFCLDRGVNLVQGL